MAYDLPRMPWMMPPLRLSQPRRDHRFALSREMHQFVVESMSLKFQQDRFSAVLAKKTGVIDRGNKTGARKYIRPLGE